VFAVVKMELSREGQSFGLVRRVFGVIEKKVEGWNST
jgi:hypothetical protein